LRGHFAAEERTGKGKEGMGKPEKERTEKEGRPYSQMIIHGNSVNWKESAK